MTELAKRLARLSPEQRALLERQLNTEKFSTPDAHITGRKRKEAWSPLSFEQQRLWFIDQLVPGNPAYNSPLAVRLGGILNIAALQQSLNEIAQRHEALRTTFALRDEQPVQVINDHFVLSFSHRDLSGYPESEREALAHDLVGEEALRPFDLTLGPLFRVQLLSLSSDQHILLLVFHHIVIDAWSIAILMRELTALYDAYQHGQPSPLPALPIQYADYALWQHQTLQGTSLDRLLTFWRQRLVDLPALVLPTDYPRPLDLASQGAKWSFTLPYELTMALQALSKSEHATLFMTMLTAFQILLARYSGQDDIVIGTSVSGRNSKEWDALIGFFVNMLVLRTDLSGNPSFREALRRVREMCLQSYTYQDLPFERLVEELHPERDPTRTPFFQVLFQSIGGVGDDSEFPGLTMEPFVITTETSKFDLLLSIREREQGIIVEAEYSTALFTAETIRRLMDHYRVLLEGLVANPECSIRLLPLFTQTERQNVLRSWNQSRVSYPQDLCLHELFEIQVQRQPQAVALIHENQRLTYAQLNARANQLAHYLRLLGTGPEVVVGLCVERSIEMVVGILGILKAGGAYMPLDPAYPQERLAFMLADTSAPIVLTQKKLVPGLPSTSAIIYLDTDWPDIARKSDETLPSGVNPSHLAYIIYTSGSTGTPKGIAVLHRGVVNNIIDLNRRFAVDSADSVLALSSLSFDMCVYEVLGLLGAGGTVILPSASAAKDPEYWARLLEQHHITIWNSAPSLLELLVEHCEQSRLAYSLRLRLALLGGDWIPVTLPDRLKVLAPAVQFISLGGATEASIHSIIYPVEVSNPAWKSIPYGRPMANQQAYILDPYLQPVPVGVPGELHLGGIGLARGYLSRPDLTAQKFIPHPFSQVPGERLYKTGDLARYGSDGTIELLGRMDFLVKIHGLRIELGEIEATLRQYPAVRDTVVLVKGNETGGKQLVAYIVPSDQEPTSAELRAFLTGKLPDYMQPKAYVFLDRLPFSPNGKVDRGRLPELDQTHREAREDFIAPRDALEIKLAGAWSAVLGIDQIGIDDNFFELGGDSFKAIQTARACSKHLALIDFFKNATIRRLANHLRQQSAAPARLLYELTSSATKPELSLVCIPYGGGNAISYQPLADNLPNGYRLYSVALPGHDFARGDEECISLDVLASSCVEEIISTIEGESLALYGQCAGAALTIEIARQLEGKGFPLQATYLGAALPDQEPLRSLEFEKGISDEDMLEWLRWLGGFEEILDPQETQYIIRAVRHDLVNAANYYKKASASQPARLKTPIFCIIGTEDGATRAYETRFQEWSYFGESVRLLLLQGANHYFVKHNAKELARIISSS